MAYTIREITDARAIGNGKGEFDTFDAAIAYIRETFEVLGEDDFEGFSAIVTPKGKPWSDPIAIEVIEKAS